MELDAPRPENLPQPRVLTVTPIRSWRRFTLSRDATVPSTTAEADTGA